MKYLFIDGQYLESAYKDIMQDFFGDDGEIDLTEVKNSTQASRVYYYHALEDEVRHGETEQEMQERIQTAQERFDDIAALPNFHVRLGTLSGKAIKRKRQKQVDVQLAVDMLTHGFGRNMSQAVLLSGDLDFRPVIETLVNMGVNTNVWYEARSASKGLYRAADVATPITALQAFNWSGLRTTNQPIVCPRSFQPPPDSTRPIPACFNTEWGAGRVVKSATMLFLVWANTSCSPRHTKASRRIQSAILIFHDSSAISSAITARLLGSRNRL